MTTRPGPGNDVAPPTIAAAARMPAADLMQQLGTDTTGLSAAQAATRLTQFGPNAVRAHQAHVLAVLWRQLRSPLLGLLMIAATASFFVGQRTDAVIIAVIVAASVGLGLTNEYRAERAADALHSRIRHHTVVWRDHQPTQVDVAELVPGDIVQLQLGEIVPADLRLLQVNGLECDESILTGESLPTAKSLDLFSPTSALAELNNCALMGTVVHAGSATGVVLATGPRTAFGSIAEGLATRSTDTEFQIGLRRFSMLLVYVAAALTITIFAINVVLDKPILDALLFSLAIAVGITPQLLPAVVSTSLAAGSRRMAARKVLVKRLICIEDLGDVDVLFTDKTGTLTIGQIQFMRAICADQHDTIALLRWGMLASEVNLATSNDPAIANPLDDALWHSPAANSQRETLNGWRRLTVLPFDHARQMISTVVASPDGEHTLVVKGAPEQVLARCSNVNANMRATLDAEFAAGNRVVAVATRPAAALATITAADETQLQLQGLLVFLDPPKPDAAAALSRLAALGITVKIVTGDNPVVAIKVCQDLGIPTGNPVTGTDLDRLDNTQLTTLIASTTVFARVSPEHKARIVRVQRLTGRDVAFLGDGVNDALALHAADVGISVDSGTDVAKDAADVILLEKNLDVLADGVVEGRRIFANTIKYVLMGTSSNFGNMFSAAGASLFLRFLPMLPSQILLNNLLYDTSQLAIPTDNVDPEQLRRPSHWDIHFIRRFMLYFGPFSSLFDFATFAVMLWVFHSGPAQFRTGWFVESLATQTLVIFAIRTRRIPFFRSHPSLPLTLAALGVVTVGAILPATTLAHALGFQPLPAGFFAALALMVVCYLALIEVGKRLFYGLAANTAPTPARTRRSHRPQRRRAAHFSARNHHHRHLVPRRTGPPALRRQPATAQREGETLRNG